MREIEICPICNKNEVEVDDMGFYGCNSCYNKVDVNIRRRALQKSFDYDLTGQDWEAYHEN